MAEDHPINLKYMSILLEKMGHEAVFCENGQEALQLLHEMQLAGEQGAVATLICDSGQRYEHSFFNDQWLHAQGLDVAPWRELIGEFLQYGRWPDALTQIHFERGG